MLVRSAAFVAAFAFPAFLAAGDFWQDKPASEWSDKDVKRLVTRSPWAKETAAVFDRSAMRMGMPDDGGGRRGNRGGGGGDMEGAGGGPGIGGGPGSGMGGPGGMRGGGMGGPGMGGGGMGGPGGGPGGTEPPKATVHWESAGPMREAAAKLENPAAQSLAEWSKEFYVITLSGMPMMRRRGEAGDQQRQPDPERMKQFAERLRGVTTLKRKGKDDLAPARVELIRGPEGMATAFLFPRSEAITADDKEVFFETAMGPMRVQSKFILKEMMVQGKPEL
jgi:hypothetical protein